MEEINIHYWVPENHEELEQLVGKRVGVMITGINDPEPMIYLRELDGKYEFLQPGINGRESSGIRSETPIRKIWGWRSNKRHIEFKSSGIRERGGVKLCSCCRQIVPYTPKSKEWEDYVRMLKLNNLWIEPS